MSDAASRNGRRCGRRSTAVAHTRQPTPRNGTKVPTGAPRRWQDRECPVEAAEARPGDRQGRAKAVTGRAERNRTLRGPGRGAFPWTHHIVSRLLARNEPEATSPPGENGPEEHPALGGAIPRAAACSDPDPCPHGRLATGIREQARWKGVAAAVASRITALALLSRSDPRRLHARSASVHLVVCPARAKPVHRPPRRHRMLRQGHGGQRPGAGDNRPHALHGRRVLPLRPWSKNFSSTHRLRTCAARGWTTSRTQSGWTATKSAPCWSRLGWAQRPSTR
jgi:hypothetical protein